MDVELKAVLGKMLGEIFRIQKHLDMPRPADHVIYGLKVGMEHVLDEQLSFISQSQYNSVCEILNRYIDNPEALSGFYVIEDELKNRGVSRDVAIVILTYLKLCGSYIDVIERLDSDNSPMQCRTFDVLEGMI